MAIEIFRPYTSEDVKKYEELKCWPGLTWAELLRKVADVYPDKPAVIDGNSRLTYSQLKDKVDRLAIALMNLGIDKGDFVLVQIPNWGEFPISFLALQRVGAIPVLLIPRHASAEINFFASLTKAKAWIVPEKHQKTEYQPIIDAVLKDNPKLDHVILARGEAHGQLKNLHTLIETALPTKSNLERINSRKSDPNEMSMLLSTGGTTGLPKACPRTHNSFLGDAEYNARAWELASRDKLLVIAPVSHGQGMVCGFAGALTGFATLVLVDSTDPKDICEMIQREKVTHIPTLPPVISRLLKYDGLKNYDLSSLKKIYLGGQRITADFVAEVESKLKCSVINAFGSVEGLLTQTRPGDDFETVCNTIGKPCCPYTEVKIVDAEGNRLPPEEEGELVSKGPTVFTGYYRSDNSAVFTKDGFVKHGDLAKIDGKGYITLTGRIKDLVRRGGENISAFEIEKLILQNPEVADVAIIAMPDKVLGERVCAYLQAKPGSKITFDEVIDFLKKHGASVNQLPERIEFVDSIPYTKVGKEADKKALRMDIKRRMGWTDPA